MRSLPPLPRFHVDYATSPYGKLPGCRHQCDPDKGRHVEPFYSPPPMVGGTMLVAPRPVPDDPGLLVGYWAVVERVEPIRAEGPYPFTSAHGHGPGTVITFRILSGRLARVTTPRSHP